MLSILVITSMNMLMATTDGEMTMDEFLYLIARSTRSTITARDWPLTAPT